MSEPAVSEGGGAYERGVVAGEISARLAGHDKHFASINGSLIDVAAAMKAMNLQLQRMADAMQADRERAIATAEALEKADAARGGMCAVLAWMVSIIRTVVMTLFFVLAGNSPQSPLPTGSPSPSPCTHRCRSCTAQPTGHAGAATPP